jgi:amidase
MDLTHGTLEQFAEALATGEWTAVELAQAAIKRIKSKDGRINAVCVEDFDRALEAARAADIARATGDRRPLLGIPMLVKESFNVAGLPTTWGIPPFKDFVAKEDAVAVARAKAAGAIILGKTNVPLGLGDLQTYNAIYGVTNNPWDESRTPGGSSGGSAAALAAGYVPLSIGSDIAGSLRVPAHFCGVYAHKPTYGVIPTRGHTPPPAPALPFERDLSVVGPMARSAYDLAVLFDVLAGPDEETTGAAYQLALPPSRHEHLRDFRVLVLDDHPAIRTASNVRVALGHVTAYLERAGAKVDRASGLLPDLMEAAGIYMRLLLAAIGASLPPEAYEGFGAQAASLDADNHSLAAQRLRGGAISHRDWIAADSQRTELRRQWRALFEAYDVVLCPVSPTTAFTHDHSPNPWARKITVDGEAFDYADQLVWSGLASAPGLPATAIPIGRDDRNLPIGAQVIGPMYGDRTTLRFAQLLEKQIGGFTAPFRR